MKPQFGKLTDAYNQARQGYPKEIHEMLVQKVQGSASVLDVGCGTGISTRELAMYFDKVTGTDMDTNMIKKAMSHEGQGITYHVAEVSALPFADEQFDLVTAFSAFHWFTNDASVEEIKRVLKPGGIFATINKKDTNQLRRIFEEVLMTHGVEAETSVKRGSYNPANIMKAHDFNEVQQHDVVAKEQYTLESALLLMQSWNAWSYVDEERKESALAQIRKKYEALCRDGVIERELEIMLVMGRK